MAREALRGFLQLGVFITLTGLCSAWLLPKDTGEFGISLCASGIGLVLVIAALVAWRLLK
jgi:hypothetical protein